MPYTLCVIGCGTMGVAVLSGVLSTVAEAQAAASPTNGANGHGENGNVASPISRVAQQVSASEPSPSSSQIFDSDLESLPDAYIATVHREESVRRLTRTFRAVPGGSAVKIQAGKNVEAAATADVILLCCKPQMAQSILTEEGMSQALDGKLLISILAGTKIAQLQAWAPPTARVVRAMPNTPCKIREGMTVCTPPSSSNMATLDRKILTSMFSPIGRCRFLEEKHFDACTALSGSGPAFACLVLEAMADGGVMMGLPRAEALELAAQTMQGAARMVLQSGSHPAAIKDSVTTPGGCTIAGLLTLEDGRVRSTIARCIQTATQHASGLGGSTNASGIKK